MAATDPTTLCAAPADMHLPIDPAHVAQTFCYVRGNTPETTLQLLHNGQVSYGSNEPHGAWTYEWRASGVDGWRAAYGKGVFTMCFQGNLTSDKPPRGHVFTQLDDTNAYRLIEQNPAWSVVIIEKK